MNDQANDNETSAVLEYTADIASAFVANNRINPGELPALIQMVSDALKRLALPPAAPETVYDRPSPSDIRKSVTDGGIRSFLDGNSYQSLKRHLSAHGLSPDDYRARYGLPDTYPTVAPAYSARRSAAAKAIGLGQKGRQAPKPPAGAEAPAKAARKPRKPKA